MPPPRDKLYRLISLCRLCRFHQYVALHANFRLGIAPRRGADPGKWMRLGFFRSEVGKDMARTRNVLAALAWAAGGVAWTQGPPARPTAVECPLLESGVCLQPAQPAPAPTATAPPSATGPPPAGQADKAKKAPTVE